MSRDSAIAALPPGELIIDSFAGGGGASLGIELALGRSPDVAINHDAEAIALHAANHPTTRHYREDVWKVDPREATGGRRVGLMWLSPDCKHFSKAKGGKPVSKRVRGLAWVAVRWAKAVKPRVIVLENVEEFQTWGPIFKTHTHGCTGDHRRPRLDRHGDPISYTDGRDRGCKSGCQFGRPDSTRKGLTFRRFVGRLRNLGYEVQWRELRACDFGAPTIRKRLFLIARCDGQPIVWPRPTHGKGTPQPWRTAAECIDFTIPTPSIFLTPVEAKAWGRANGRAAPKRPLAEATLNRIAAGLRRFVLEAPRPFIVQVQNASAGDTPIDLNKPLRTVTAHPKGGGFALAAPVLVPRYGERLGQEPRARASTEPMATVVPTQNGASLVSAFLAKHQSERGNEVQAASLFDPVPTVKTRDSNAVVTSTLVALRGGESAHQHGDDITEPLRTVSAGGTHHAEVRAFLVAYYGNEKDGGDLFTPMRTVTSRERFGLVTVDGTEYAIADIGMRMLEARELYRAQGFPDSYRIDIPFNGKPMTKEAQVRMCGNSVCPPVAAAIVRANLLAAPAAAVA